MRSYLLITAMGMTLIVTLAAIAVPNLLRSRISVQPAAYNPQMAERDAAGRPSAMHQVPDLRQTIKTGSLNLLVKSVAEAAERIGATAAEAGGYVEAAELSGRDDASKSGHMVVRVPATRLDDVRQRVRQLSRRVEDEKMNTEDVTQRAVDLDATLRNYRAEEAQLLEIMHRSGTIGDTLAVAERLSDVRGRIERTQAQRNLLRHQVEMASLNIWLRVEQPVAVAESHWRPWQQTKAALDGAKDAFADYFELMVAVLFRLPVVLLWLLSGFALGGYGWKLLRWLWGFFVVLEKRPTAAEARPAV